MVGRTLTVLLLLLTGVRSKVNSMFEYRALGDDVILPCSNSTLNCSSITWTFYRAGQVHYTDEVVQGRVSSDSDKSSRMSITPDCSIVLRDLIEDDAGTYFCRELGERVGNIYLSLLTITSPSAITDLQPGRNISLSCKLQTYYDIGSCTEYSTIFSLSWTDGDGATLPKDTRYKQILDSRCSITLVIELKREDNNRKWRCQMNTTGNSRVAFLDFTSAFVFENPSQVQQETPVAIMDCPVTLPYSRIVLCVALPVMVIIVEYFRLRRDRKRAKTSGTAGIELQEVK